MKMIKQYSTFSNLIESANSNDYVLLGVSLAHQLNSIPGLKARIVGGFVRDLMTFKKVNENADIDIVVEERNEGILENKLSELCNEDAEIKYTVDFIGKHFGVYMIKVLYNNNTYTYEIALTRKDVYNDDYTSLSIDKNTVSLEEDLSRRDFTVNTLLLTINNGVNFKLESVGTALDDIHNRTLRFVGDAYIRIKEDPIRIFRAYRFGITYPKGYNTLIKPYVKDNYKLLDSVNINRIRDELIKIVNNPKSFISINRMVKARVLDIFCKELYIGLTFNQQNPNHKLKLTGHILSAYNILERCKDTTYKYNKDYRVKLAILLHDIGKLSTGVWNPNSNKMNYPKHDIVSYELSNYILKKFKFSNNDIKYITNLIRYHMISKFDKSTKNIYDLCITMVKNNLIDNGFKEDLLLLSLADTLGKTNKYTKVDSIKFKNDQNIQWLNDNVDKMISLIKNFKNYDIYSYMDIITNNVDKKSLSYIKRKIIVDAHDGVYDINDKDSSTNYFNSRIKNNLSQISKAGVKYYDNIKNNI